MEIACEKGMVMDMPYKKNDYVTVTIEDMGSEGEGIGKVDGFTLFVKDAVIGDIVEAKIVKSKKNYAYARLEKVIQPSPFRVEPKCPSHRQCGGCQMQALSYEKQLAFKFQKIRNNLIRIGGFDAEFVDAHMEPMVGMEEPYHYRNKAQYPVGTDKDGKIIAGFYAGRTHTIIPNTSCCLGVPENEEILNTILAYMRENKVSAYDETNGQGLLRHILIRTGFTSKEIMVCLVVNKDVTGMSFSKSKVSLDIPKEENSQIGNQGKSDSLHESYIKEQSKSLKKSQTVLAQEFLPNQEDLIRRLSQIKNMTSVSVSINTERTNVIMGKEVHTLWGEPTISDTIHVRNMREEGCPFTGQELTFKISPLSFYQVNPVQTEKLYSTALEYAGLTGKETVWDLYCGIGTISLFLAAGAKQVYGVEIVPQAIEDARENAKRNHISNVQFFVGKAEEVLPDFYEGRLVRVENGKVESVSKQCTQKTEENGDSSNSDMCHPDVIVVDPPRKGCDEACLSVMLKMRPKRIVYVSCDSATLARDLRVLCDGGYEIRRIRGFDQFPQGVHVETVVGLQRQDM
ncbi:MAG: class I SAM-dependent RNA methyltransferase [Bacteroidales bacterium]|nr:class I SAM-dependent RNA methyltransferase [Lachnoclostridium sp.]MCM1384877.1 class I SAM-dependent RNA methyltransferase [Lachnoclostridium sp.]MCM1465587.1 class I SAM-dependent RNA methyltransferase [Bacteroidales bacterium]